MPPQYLLTRLKQYLDKLYRLVEIFIDVSMSFDTKRFKVQLSRASLLGDNLFVKFDVSDVVPFISVCVVQVWRCLTLFLRSTSTLCREYVFLMFLCSVMLKVVRRCREACYVIVSFMYKNIFFIFRPYMFRMPHGTF